MPQRTNEEGVFDGLARKQGDIESPGERNGRSILDLQQWTDSKLTCNEKYCHLKTFEFMRHAQVLQNKNNTMKITLTLVSTFTQTTCGTPAFTKASPTCML